MFVILRDPRVKCVIHQLVAGIHIRTADNHHAAGFASIVHLHRPRSSALGVAWCKVCNQHGPAKPHFIAVVQHTVYLHWLVVIISVPAILEISFAAGFDDVYIAIHYVILCAGLFLDQSAARAMVPMRMADKKDLGIAEM